MIERSGLALPGELRQPSFAKIFLDVPLLVARMGMSPKRSRIGRDAGASPGCRDSTRIVCVLELPFKQHVSWRKRASQEPGDQRVNVPTPFQVADPSDRGLEIGERRLARGVLPTSRRRHRPLAPADKGERMPLPQRAMGLSATNPAALAPF